MKKYFVVSFQKSESVYCSNIAHAESVADVEAHYSKYAWFAISDATDGDLREAERKGKPIVEIEPAPIEETETAPDAQQEPETRPASIGSTKYEAIIAAIEDMNTEDRIEIWNTYERETNGEFEIYSMQDFDDVMYGYEPLDIARKIFYGDFRAPDDYFQFDGYANLSSFNFLDEDSARFSPSDIATEILARNDSFGFDEIQDILDDDEIPDD